ncbi:helix-turn-helix transcriptional regulator [Salmonella enterica]|uniref:AlpA family phage regulatory protein n=1 Tax=Salmonella enterica TaxID=28901 RepID=UPI000F985A39|nr:DNA-binding protein [Salmonella enterica]ECI5659691.1 AlpA family phage regulatory protein [Salmonella enterica subsp. diarizonae]EHE1282204.1 AlpA family phage regulatory protein [Salmonella enterica]EJM5006427.1 AlpA family phage regulatory protein [Salmonella enterica]EJQ9335883.1 AlpA family phage regulatory protein [Salmonella enterica]
MPKKESDRIVREEECRELSGLCRTARYVREKAGTFPARRNIGGRSVGWMLSEIQEWQKTRQKQTETN